MSPDERHLSAVPTPPPEPSAPPIDTNIYESSGYVSVNEDIAALEEALGDVKAAVEDFARGILTLSELLDITRRGRA